MAETTHLNPRVMALEPDRGTAVRDRHGYVSERYGDLWRCAADGQARTWEDLQSLGPLRLLIDGPVLMPTIDTDEEA